MKKLTICLIVAAFLLGTAGCINEAKTDQDKAVKLAKELYEQEKAKGTDFEEGPCLSNEIMPDWVADIANNPRKKVDNLPENQCSAYLEGKAHHFVELDKNGNFVRAR